MMQPIIGRMKGMSIEGMKVVKLEGTLEGNYKGYEVSY
jgi:hypothetical protein